MTITEALAEIKTIGKRLATKREFVLNYLAQDEDRRDPLEREEGGSTGAIKRERQAVDDLEQRIVDIRSAIARSNERTAITIFGKTRSVTEWLAWRKDVSEGQRQFLSGMRQKIYQMRAASGRQTDREVRLGGRALVHASASTGEQRPSNINVFIDEQKLAKESEQFEETLGQLDGQLSLKNATTQIDLK